MDNHILVIKSHYFKSHPECGIFQTMAGATDVCNLSEIRKRTKSLSLYSLCRHNNVDLESTAGLIVFSTDICSEDAVRWCSHSICVVARTGIKVGRYPV